MILRLYNGDIFVLKVSFGHMQRQWTDYTWIIQAAISTQQRKPNQIIYLGSYTKTKGKCHWLAALFQYWSLIVLSFDRFWPL